jgi:hypothetical protein
MGALRFSGSREEIVAKDALVERVVLELNDICRSATLDFTLSIGRTIITNFYSGNVSDWRDRGPKAAPFRRLARHPDLPMSPAALYRCVAIYEVCLRLGIEKCKHISTSHIRQVLARPPDEQRMLLAKAECERWTVNRLHHETAVLKEHAPVRRRGGRKAEPRINMTLRKLEKFIDDDDNFVGLGQEPAEFTVENKTRIIGVIQRVQRACATLASYAEKYSDGGAPASEPALQRMGGFDAPGGP